MQAPFCAALPLCLSRPPFVGHLERQRLDGKWHSLGREERPHEVFDGNAIGFKRREKVAPAQRREFKRTRCFTPYAFQCGTQRIGGPNRGAASDADRQAARRNQEIIIDLFSGRLLEKA
jgi:hypothetical protein